MVTNFLHLIPIIKKIRTSLIKFRFLDYSRLKLFHNITALAMLLIIFHVLMAAPTSENNYRLAMVGSWGAISILVYAYHKLVRYFWRKSQALNLSEVKSISPDVLYLIARPNKYLPKHRAGQFGYFRLLSPACGIEEHPFTIASDPESKTLDIMIKILGDYTLKLKNLPAETKMLFDGPYGLFTPKLNAHQYLFIAGGIGITPFLAIIREWSNSKISKPVTLIWSVRRNEDLVDDGLFERVAEEHKYFNYVKVLTRDENVPSRHIDLELLTEVFPENDLNDIQAYLCGPESLQKDVSRLLKKLGLRRKQIHYESFGY